MIKGVITIKKLEEILSLAQKKPKKTISVAAAQDKEVLTAVADAVKLGLVDAILVGDGEKIKDICQQEDIDCSSMMIINEKNVIEAANKAVDVVAEGKADYIMKGILNTSDLLKAVLNKEKGLRGKGLLSHVMVYEIPAYHKLLFLTDGGMVPFPSLQDKIEIINNSVLVAEALDMKKPKVAPVCAVEVVNPSMQSTVDAAILSKMNKRGQIKNCIIDGPLALDNAISIEAATHKGIVSDVAGDSDILLVPNIEAGNMLGKGLTYFAGAEGAGVVMGAKCPIVLVSRADSARAKLYSIALGSVVSN